MKKLILASLLSMGLNMTINTQVTAQSAEVGNCYFEWAKVFEARGANDVEDGTHSDVIITIRSGSEADCFNGKCEVVGGKITAMYIRLEDGKFEPFKRKARFNDIPITINNGMSTVLLTEGDEIINVLFIKKIKPKKASFQKAAGPSDF